ncbi:MAG: hypothetical protein K0Q97_2817 [Bacillota bacterium]|nr:hypothetical protein [Bacillota bacterium]
MKSSRAIIDNPLQHNIIGLQKYYIDILLDF